MRSVKSALLLAVALCACSDGVAPGTIAGRWVRDFTVAGSSLEMDLTNDGGTISGTGDWCAEAGPCGTLAVTGTINGGLVHLDLTLTPTFPPGVDPGVEHFDGRFTSLQSLRGTLSAEIPGQTPVVLGETGFHRM
jgi:hypothetical protein